MTSSDRGDNSGVLGLGYPNQSDSSSQPSGNLSLYWRLDRSIPGTGGTVKDYSGEGNSGKTVGSVSTSSEGVFGTKGFSFDGDNDKLGSSYTEFGAPNQSFTVSAWFKSSSNVAGSNYAFLTNYPGSSGNDGFWMIGTNDGSSGMFFWMRDQDRSDSAKTSKYDVFDGEWHHIAGVRDAEDDEIRFYIDGQLKQDKVFDGSEAVTDSDGNSNFSVMEHYGRHLEGQADEIQVRTQALTNSEVEDLYFQGMNGKFTGNYTRSFQANKKQSWKQLEVNASLPANTSLDVEFRAQDSSGNTLETESFNLNDSLKNYTLSVRNSEQAEVFFNGTSENATRTWKVDSFKLYSEEVKKPEERLDVSNQQEFNQGDFNGTSADREFNSGNLGLGYKNDTDENEFTYFRFDSSQPIDYSGKQRNGILSGGDLTGADGVFGTQSYDFDGNNYVNVSTVPQQTGSNLTVSVWVNKDNSGNYNNKGLSGKWGSTNAYTLWTSADTSEFKPQFSVVTENGRSDAKAPVLSDGWHHVVGTFGDAAKIYVDGELEAKGSEIGGEISNSAETLVIGSYTDNKGKFTIDAKLDEYKQLNSTLTSKEVKKLYFHGLNGKFSGEYGSEKIDSTQKQNWTDLEVDATVPEDTNLTAKFQVLDSDGVVKEEELIDIRDGYRNYSLRHQSSKDAKVVFNGTSRNASKTWTVDGFSVYSKALGSTGEEVTWNRWS